MERPLRGARRVTPALRKAPRVFPLWEEQAGVSLGEDPAPIDRKQHRQLLLPLSGLTCLRQRSHTGYQKDSEQHQASPFSDTELILQLKSHWMCKQVTDYPNVGKSTGSLARSLLLVDLLSGVPLVPSCFPPLANTDHNAST